MFELTFTFFVSDEEALNAQNTLKSIAEDADDHVKRNIVGELCKRVSLQSSMNVRAELKRVKESKEVH